MQFKEIPLVFDCRDEKLLGILHQGNRHSSIGVLIIVGGPQYRIGSHRQFVLLARYLALHGISVMRFDVRGMGDSDGEPRNFTDLDDDIASAVDCFMLACPELEGVVLWGLCDAASAASFYAYQDARIQGLVLLNPWVFTERGSAKTLLKYYYVQRIVSREFWRKVLTRCFDYSASLATLFELWQKSRCWPADIQIGKAGIFDDHLALPIRMRKCLKRFSHPVLLILSERDLTADEFRETVKTDSKWQTLLADPRVTRHELPEADHTFSSSVWRDRVAEWTLNWLQHLGAV